MKKLFALALVVFGLAACQTEPEGLDVQMGGEQEVMLTVSLPETTRANSANGFDVANIADTDYTLRYILEIYRVGDTNGTCQRHVLVSDKGSVAFPVRLVPRYNYNVVVWADIVRKDGAVLANGEKADRYYDTQKGLDEITIIENDDIKWNAMDETRDAYTATVTFNDFKVSDLNETISLTRPFAKLRVVATDYEDVDKLGLKPATATVVYSQDNLMPRTYNARTGEATGADSKSHAISYATPVYDDHDATGEYTLFADYIFVPQSGTTVKFLLKVYADGSKLIKENNFNTEIFVQRNKLTTIKGDVLTTGGNVTIKVENELGQLETINYADNAETLQEIINEAPAGEQTNITLGGDINLGDLLNAGILSTTRAEKEYGLLISAGKEVVLDLNGCTISQTKKCTANYSMIVNKGNLTITDSSENGTGKISFKDTGAGDPNFGWGSYTLRNEGTLVVENGTIEHLGEQNPGNGQPNVHMYCAIFQYSGKSTINGGVISTPTYRSARLWNGEMTINGGQFVGQLWLQAVSDNANLVINGGEFTACGNDGSSVFVSNSGKAVKCSINGGLFNNKVGMSEPFGCITGGTFTTAAKEATSESLLNSDYEFVESGENWIVQKKPAIAKIGEVGYTSLQKAVAAVQDGETITLVANETFTEKNYYDNGGWKDGLGYAGDKSFTIDLGGKTVSQNGALNDYLIWIKNVGSKANTITIKNGTLDAGTTAYCALCTASSHENKLTINLEDVNLINNKYDGSTIRVRGGSELNVKSGTKITGKNSYLGIENWKSTINIYDGAEIYMNGTSSYNGCLVGVGGNGVINVYGGYGKGVKGGFIAMTSGGTINISGGEWIANTNGTIGDNSNVYVLTAQNNKYEGGYAGASIINVTGGTFRGGMDAWVLNDVTVEKAELNIKGGNFNANPSSYLAEGCEATEANGVWNVRVIPVAKIGNVEYETFEAAVAAAEAGNTIELLNNVTPATSLTLPAGITLNGNGYQINGTIIAGGDLTIICDTKIGTLKAVNGGTITIENGKTLTLNNFSFGAKDSADAEYEIKGGTVTANYGFFQHGKYTLRSNFETGYMYYSYGSDITVYGTFHSEGKGDGLDYVRGKLTIAEGGKSIHDKSLWVGQPASWGAMSASLVIEEGGYVQANSLSVYEGSSLTYSNDADLKYNSVTGGEYITKK